jgi:putative tryptophan/tyrosine transport system substrate-binding protein
VGLPSQCAIEYRWAEGRKQRASEIAAEFVRLKVDVIVTAGSGNRHCGKASDVSHPDRVRSGGGPVGSRPRRQPPALSVQAADQPATRNN